jgi:SNF2 family DNA or RNA helicase
VNAFQAGEGDVLLIRLKAGGSGLNLTAADYVIHMDPPEMHSLFFYVLQ